MQEIEIRCKGCGKKLLKYSQSSFRKYGSPLKNCKKCGMRYADPRYREIAIEGVPKDTFSISSYLILVHFYYIEEFICSECISLECRAECNFSCRQFLH